MIKVVSFDIGGTLLKNSGNDKYNIKALALLLDKPSDVVKKAYKDIFQKKKGTFDELVVAFCNNVDIQRNKDIDYFFHNKFNMNEGTISKENIDIIKKLKDRGYKVILFSNNCCLFKSAITSELKNLVDDIFYSYDIGYTKNDNESYKIVEQKIGYKPNEFLHIGDTLKSDYLKPIENGWHALYYGITNDDSIRAIKELNEVFKYLK